jgi:hypothetical protein
MQFDELLNRLRSDLINGKDILDSINDLTEIIFSIRIKALRWLAKQNRLNLDETLNEAEKFNQGLSNEERFELLSENIGFAIRTIRRVTKAIIKKIPSKEELQDNFKSIPELGYWDFFDLMSIAIPNEELLEKLMEWVDSSIELEYGVLASILLLEENLNVSSRVINELAELIAFVAQNYSAYSVELGIMPMRVIKSEKAQYSIPDEAFIKEQQLLADSGLEDLEGM